MRTCTALLSAAAALAIASPACAAIVTSNFNIVNPVLGLIGSGSATIDDSLLDAFGDGGGFDPGDLGFGLEVTLLGVNLNESADIDYPGYPETAFEGFELAEIDFIVEDGVNGVDFSGTALAGFAVDMGLVTIDPTTGQRVVNAVLQPLEAVPAPGALGLLGLGLIGAAAARRRRA